MNSVTGLLSFSKIAVSKAYSWSKLPYETIWIYFLLKHLGRSEFVWEPRPHCVSITASAALWLVERWMEFECRFRTDLHFNQPVNKDPFHKQNLEVRKALNFIYYRPKHQKRKELMHGFYLYVRLNSHKHYLAWQRSFRLVNGLEL